MMILVTVFALGLILHGTWVLGPGAFMILVGAIILQKVRELTGNFKL